MELVVTIGVDGDVVERLRYALDARFVAYPAVPRLYSLEGRVFVESATVAGRWLQPRGIIYYGYFDDAGAARRARGGRLQGVRDGAGDDAAGRREHPAGRSERVLLVGDQAWHLRYESADWRKNVAATVTTIEPEPLLVARARRTAERLGLSVAGVDYIVNDGGATLLEVNAYPGFDDADGAPEAFVSLAADWWRRLMPSS